MNTILARIMALALALCSISTVAIADDAVFVAGGKPQSVREVGQAWERGDGFLRCSGMGNYLVGGKQLDARQFTVRAQISIEKFDATAASLAFSQNNFGFDGRGGKLFVEGTAVGKTRSVGNAADFITPGKPFVAEVVCQAGTITFRIDGKEVHRGQYRLESPVAVALRPWRSTMTVTEFSATGTAGEVTSDAIARLARDWKRARSDEPGLLPSITIGGMEIDPTAPPAGLVTRPDLGLVTSVHLDGQVVHTTGTNLFETRATITPGGDYLLMFPEGQHYGGRDERRWRQRVNRMIAYRSSDRGKTWQGPTVAFDVPYGMHGFIPLVPRGTKRLYCFGTEPMPDKRELSENCLIGFRYSDDDGRTWSEVTLIEPQNDPDFRGMSVMRMCETDAGTWLLGSHEATHFFRRDDGMTTCLTRQYVLRSEDRGKTWTVLPDKRPGGWQHEKLGRMEEGRPIALGNGRVLMHLRTATGFLWEARSEDDGKTWSEPKPTRLVHPLAPPMTFHLGDGKTLIALHHNRTAEGPFAPYSHRNRSELWASLSTDGGRTWTEPRFLLANALTSESDNPWHACQCSYADLFRDGDTLHIFLPHQWKRALHLTLKADDIDKLPTRADLEKAPRVEKTLLFGAGEGGYAVFRIPGIVVTTKGTVLAYCVGRKTPGDWADIDIYLRRSTDGGKTWEPRRRLRDEGTSTVDNPTAIVDRETGAVHMLYQVDYARCYTMRSDDDAKTFTEPVDITPVFEEFRKEYDWNVIAPGPGHGIQLTTGRLVVPVWLSTGGRRHRPSIVAVIYSDDHGRSWHRGDVVARTDEKFVNPSETVAVELTDGRVMLNIRNECPRHRRLVSFSKDGATGWTEPVFDGTLFEPICFGSIQRFSARPAADKNRILFVNPNSGSRDRRNLTVRLSCDEGKTWPVGKVLEPGIAGYSDLAVGPDGTIYCLYERGGIAGNHYHTRGITVARFTLPWLTDQTGHSGPS